MSERSATVVKNKLPFNRQKAGAEPDRTRQQQNLVAALPLPHLACLNVILSDFGILKSHFGFTDWTKLQLVRALVDQQVKVVTVTVGLLALERVKQKLFSGHKGLYDNKVKWQKCS